MKKIVIGLILLAVLFSGCVNNETIGNDTGNDTVACTEDARECPDGSFVVRIPPSCEFAACPEIQENESEEITTAAVSIVGYSFVPNELTVSAGTTVVWNNIDTRSHAIGSSKFDAPGTLKEGESGNYTFDTPGTYSYTCPFHYAKGKVIVTT